MSRADCPHLLHRPLLACPAVFARGTYLDGKQQTHGYWIRVFFFFFCWPSTLLVGHFVNSSCDSLQVLFPEIEMGSGPLNSAVQDVLTTCCHCLIFHFNFLFILFFFFFHLKFCHFVFYLRCCKVTTREQQWKKKKNQPRWGFIATPRAWHCLMDFSVQMLSLRFLPHCCEVFEVKGKFIIDIIPFIWPQTSEGRNSSVTLLDHLERMLNRAVLMGLHFTQGWLGNLVGNIRNRFGFSHLTH